MHSQTVYTVRSASLYARIAVRNKGVLEELMCVVEVEVMNYSVAEHRGKYLPLLWIIDNESISTAEVYTYELSDHRTTLPNFA